MSDSEHRFRAVAGRRRRDLRAPCGRPTLRSRGAPRLFALACVALLGCAGAATRGTPAPARQTPVAPSTTAQPRWVLPAGQTARPPVLIRHAEVWTGRGEVLRNHDLLLEAGVIRRVGVGLQAPAGARVIDAAGRVVTPGLVDLHSHLGVYAAPQSGAHNDGNESTAPLTPFVRAIDSFDPEDPSIARALGGGVTSALILPGSANIMGGQGVVVKLRGATVGDMARLDAPMQLKMAMGENPKRVYRGKGRIPSTRMGHAWLMRDRFAAARQAIEEEDKARASGKEVKPADRSLLPLMALIRGRARLHVHCYEVHDIETLLRVTGEAGVQVAAIHHALEAWKVGPLLRAAGVGVATFADLWGFKLEAWDASVHGPARLHREGVALALKSDHPVLEARDLMWEAAKAHHHGLPAQAALAAVTRVPAELMGLGAQIGTIETGKEADVVIWAAPPLITVGARPTHVLVDGVVWVDPAGNAQQAHAGPPRTDGGSPCGCGL